MKSRYSVISVLIAYLMSANIALHAQIIWTEPAFPSVNDVVTLFYNSALGNGELQGVIPVYIHTGVITSSSTGPSDWQHVQSAWGSSDASCLMNPEGNSIHSFDFNGQTLADYYELNFDETVESLAMVFRNSSGSLVGRNADGSDIFYAIGTGAYSVQLQTPELGYAVLSIGDSFEFLAIASESSELELVINGEPVTSTSGTSLEYVFEATESGQFEILLQGLSGSNVASDTATLTVLPNEAEVGWPPSGSLDGITYLSNSSVRLQVYAPQKEHIFAVGDFNNWQLSYEYLMTPTPDATRYWIELEGLTPGEVYRFHYHIMPDDLRVADAYTELVLDPWNDPWISSETYPNLPAFPNMLTETTPVSILEPGAPDYTWTDADWVRPPSESLIIYELLTRDFTEERNFQTLVDTLDYLDRLGINAIELMPVNEFNGNDSWGYNTTFYMALDKAYGTRDSFKALVDACHNRGIAVILDFAFNHADYPNPFLRMYWNDETFKPTVNNPWFNVDAPHALNWFFDWNHESSVTQEFVKRTLSYWADEYHIDGFRWDFSQGMSQTPNGNGSYDQSRIDILNEYGDHIWASEPSFYMILEHWCDQSEEQALANNGFLMWTNVSYEYQEAVMGYASNLNWANYQSHGMSVPAVISYPESHDEERLMYKALNYGNSSGGNSIQNLETALARMEAIQCFHLPLPGPKMIWQFEELGYDFSINTCSDGVTVDESCRVDAKPVRWDYRDETNRYRIHEVITALAHLKTNYAGTFNTDDFTFDTGGFGKRLLLYNGDMDAVIVGNFHVSNITMIPGFSHTGTWYDYFSGESLEVNDINDVMDFEPGEYHVYLDEPIQNPIQNSILEDRIDNDGSRAVCFPNPTAGTTALSIDLPRQGTYFVEIQNAQFQLLEHFEAHSFRNGMVRYPLDISSFSDGIYFIVITQGSYKEVIRVIVNH